MGRRSNIRVCRRAGLVGALALATMLLFGAPAGAQVVIEETGNLIDTGEIALQIGDNCFAEETVGIGTAVATPEYGAVSTATILTAETALVQVPCAEDPGGEPDEVLGIVEEPDEVLAFTGSDINRPISLGFALVGAGGLILCVAKRAEARRDEEPAEA